MSTVMSKQQNFFSITLRYMSQIESCIKKFENVRSQGSRWNAPLGPKPRHSTNSELCLDILIGVELPWEP